MTDESGYQLSIDRVFFQKIAHDELFRKNVKPYIKDKFRFERALALLNYPEGKKIYEMGPYPGTGVYYFGEKNEILGFGKSNQDFLEKFNESGHEIVDVDFESLVNEKDLMDADIVLVMEVLEHIRMSHNFVNKLSKMVKPGGHIYLTTNNQSYIGYILKLLSNKRILDPISTEKSFYPGHCRYYDLLELTELFEKMGYIVIHSNFINFLPDFRLYKNRKFGALKNMLIKLFPKRYSTHIELLIKRPE